MDTNTKGPGRSPRLDKTAARVKADALRGVLPGTLKRIAKLTPSKPKESQALAALRPQREEILALLKAGWSANAIASEIANADENVFSVETIRIAIRRLVNEGSKPAQGAKQERKQHGAPPLPEARSASQSDHAGFAEDPR